MYYRCGFRTFSETKQYQATQYNELNIKIKIRGKRSSAHLPDMWDDLIRSTIFARNWKHYRRNQWKNNGKE